MTRVARWHIFRAKNAILVNFGGPCNIGKMLVYFISIWYILCQFDIFYEQMVYFVAIGYIYPRVGILYQEKSGNPDEDKSIFALYEMKNQGPHLYETCSTLEIRLWLLIQGTNVMIFQIFLPKKWRFWLQLLPCLPKFIIPNIFSCVHTYKPCSKLANYFRVYHFAAATTTPPRGVTRCVSEKIAQNVAQPIVVKINI
jgi:hypothetical protein